MLSLRKLCMHKKKDKSRYLLFKIDFEKTYDKINWKFLRLTWSEYGFPSTKIVLIMNCITSTSLVLRWNKEVLESFNPHRGLQQGDILSPYLFVLCMEKLSILIQHVVENNSWKPVKIAKNGPGISHLFLSKIAFSLHKQRVPRYGLSNRFWISFVKLLALK